MNKIKLKYNNTCQICGVRLIIGVNKYYSEVHHIRPLGRPHNGQDLLENMVCVCPNCHILLDYKAIFLVEETFKVIKHRISDINLKYHNSLVII